MDGTLAILATAVAVGAALAFYPVRGPGGRGRTTTWLASTAVVAFSPCLISTASRPLRFVVSLIATTLLVKLYDLHREPRLAARMGVRSYLAYLPNGFWLVLREEPCALPARHDRALLARRVPAAMLALLLAASLWCCWDGSTVPFALEHVLKVSSFIVAVVLTTNAAAPAYRLLGGVAIDPMRNPIAARTPADFWRRWNRPAQRFLHAYAFRPAGGRRHPIRATLVTFAVSGLIHEYLFGMADGRIQGWQLLFFLLQGGAVVATGRARPSRRMAPLWIAATLAFNLATSWLFFRSVDAVLPFYATRGR